MKARDRQTGLFKKVFVKALDSLPVGSEIDFDGPASDIPVGWEQVDNPDSYSAEEVKTNKVWFGKPVYRKVITITVNAGTTGQVDLTSLNYSKIWINHDTSHCEYSGETSSSGVNWYNKGTSDDYGLVYIGANRTMNIKNATVNNRNYYITLEYTKATD